MLSPEEIRLIGDAVAAAYGPYALGGVVVAIFFGVLIGLKVTAPAAKRIILEEMLDPEGEPAKLRKAERDEIEVMFDRKLAELPKAPGIPDYGKTIRDVQSQINARISKEFSEMEFPEMPDFKAFEAWQAKTTIWMDQTAIILAELTPDKMGALIDQKLSNHRAAAGARAGKGETTELEEIVSIGGQAAEHPEAAMAFKGLNSLIDFAESLMDDTPANQRKIGKARAQAQRAFERGEDLIALRDQFARLYPTAYAGFAAGAPAAAARGKGGGFNPG